MVSSMRTKIAALVMCTIFSLSSGTIFAENGMDTISTGGMDTISTGGMDSIDLGGMDSFDLGGTDTNNSGTDTTVKTVKLYTSAGKLYYEGQAVNNIPEGTGKYYFDNSDWYEGNFSKGKMSGQGKYHFADGTILICNFSDDKANGAATYMFTNGDKLECMLSNGCFVANSTRKYYFKNGDRFEGIYDSNGNSNGIFYKNDGKKYNCTAQNSSFNLGEEIIDKTQSNNSNNTKSNTTNATNVTSKTNTSNAKNTNSSSSGINKISFSLNSKDMGFSIEKSCILPISNVYSDFFILNGQINCINDSKISAIPLKDVSDTAIKKALLASNMKYSMKASKNMLYTIVTPRGYFGVFMLVDVNVSKNIYKGLADSWLTDDIVKQQISDQYNKQKAKSSGMDTIETGGMDTIETGGMDTIELGGMDTIEMGGMDYFDTESNVELKNIVVEGKKKQFKIAPRIYDNGETLIALKDIAPFAGLTVTYKNVKGVDKAYISKGSKTAVLEAYSIMATINNKTVKLKKAPKMDKNGIMVPASFLSSTYGIHFSINKDAQKIAISKKAIVEWRYTGYKNKTPYMEYENKYIDGVKTKTTRQNGKKHVFKNVTLYNKKTGKTMAVPENKVSSYSKNWSTSAPAGKNGTSSSSTAFWTKYNLHNFFQSSSFDTWGGNIVRSFVP